MFLREMSHWENWWCIVPDICPISVRPVQCDTDFGTANRYRVRTSSGHAPNRLFNSQSIPIPRITKMQNAALRLASLPDPQLSPSFIQRRSQTLAQAGICASRAIERIRLKAPVEDVTMRSDLCKNRENRGMENTRMAIGNATEKRITKTIRESSGG